MNLCIPLTEFNFGKVVPELTAFGASIAKDTACGWYMKVHVHVCGKCREGYYALVPRVGCERGVALLRFKIITQRQGTLTPEFFLRD